MTCPKTGQRESVARDICKNHAIAPWANQLALVTCARFADQRAVRLQKLRYAMRVLPGLLKGIRRPNLFTLDVKRRTDFVDRAKVPELPVLDLDDQQATTRMKKMTTPSSPRKNVAPK
jgi:hypothetical protein